MFISDVRAVLMLTDVHPIATVYDQAVFPVPCRNHCGVIHPDGIDTIIIMP